MLSRSLVHLMTALVLMGLAPVAFGQQQSRRASPTIRKGVYKGDATTTAEYRGIKSRSKGTIILTVQKIDSQGHFNGKVEFTNGLMGSGQITGKIDGNGRLRGRAELDVGQKAAEDLVGATYLDYRLTVNARAEQGDKLVGTYTISAYGILLGRKHLLMVEDGKFSSTFGEGDPDDEADADDKP